MGATMVNNNNKIKMIDLANLDFDRRLLYSTSDT
jgi:hypothetical protein